MITQEIIEQRIKAQKDLCAEKKYPHFAPHNGICWCCGNQIYERKDGTSLITGCPWCARTYCD